jgi:hypothetical protein
MVDRILGEKTYNNEHDGNMSEQDNMVSYFEF